MNSQSAKMSNPVSYNGILSFVKMTDRKKTIDGRQLVLVSRIMISIVTIGFVGYTFDRIMQLFKKPASFG